MKPFSHSIEKWTEEIDEETNRSYFYSSITGEREWDQPPPNAHFVVRMVETNPPGNQSNAKLKDEDFKTKEKNVVGALETKIEVSDSAIVPTTVTNDCAQISPAEEAFRNEKGSNNDSLTEIVDDKDETANEYNEGGLIGFDDVIMQCERDPTSSFRASAGKDVCSYLVRNMTDLYARKNFSQTPDESTASPSFQDSLKVDTALWVEVVTAFEGPIDLSKQKRSYFVNERTGERCWDAPPSHAQNIVYVNSEDIWGESLGGNPAPNYAPIRGKPNLQEVNNIDTWVEVLDHNSRSYFFSTKTKQIKVDRPPSDAQFVMYVSSEIRRITKHVAQDKTVMDGNTKKRQLNLMSMHQNIRPILKFSEMSSTNLYRRNIGGIPASHASPQGSIGSQKSMVYPKISKQQQKLTSKSGKLQNMLGQHSKKDDLHIPDGVALKQCYNKKSSQGFSGYDKPSMKSCIHTPEELQDHRRHISGNDFKSILEKSRTSYSTNEIDYSDTVYNSRDQSRRCPPSGSSRTCPLPDDTYAEDLLLALKLSKAKSSVAENRPHSRDDSGDDELAKALAVSKVDK
mmetsp:Transcript_28721/g.57290  ORF Transcript_28721/g.57290 Transcript_28721/m.57290 type:complete len:569 (-) Transcript_28721:3-1709(-)